MTEYKVCVLRRPLDRENVSTIMDEAYYQREIERLLDRICADDALIAKMETERADMIPRAEADARVAAALEASAQPLIWEDTRDVHFDYSVMWGKGYDFHSWECLREEAETSDGRFAVWKCPAHGWSFYGGTLGWYKGGFADEAAAKDAVRSHHIRALTPDDTRAALEAMLAAEIAQKRARIVEHPDNELKMTHRAHALIDPSRIAAAIRAETEKENTDD
jgi:hypothetical protein